MQSEKLFYSTYFCPETLQILATAQFAGIKLELNEINKKYDPVNLVTKQGVLNKPTAILRYLASGTGLAGCSAQDKNQLNVWYEFFHTDLLPLLNELYGQIFGQKPANETKYTYCLNEINRNLKVLDESLKIKTFFVGNNLTIYDITLVCYLESLFKLVVVEGDRKKYINLFRWFNHVRSIPVFTKHLGQSFLCGKDSFKLDFTKTDEKIEVKNQVKTETKPQAKTQEKKTDSKKDVKTQAKTEPKPQIQPEAADKPNEFKLDDFKREFQNSQNKAEVLNNLLNTLNQQKFSIWKIHYDKDESEGKIDYLTQNLAKGSLQRIEGIRKVAFGTWGVYGEEGNYEIRGVMVWEGTEISPVWKDHPAFEYHKFTKLSPQNEEDRKLIKDYILEAEKAEGLTLKDATRIL